MMLLIPNKHISILLGIIIMLVFNYLLSSTKIGKGMRAVSDNPI